MIFADLLARMRLIPAEVGEGKWLDIGGYSSNHHRRCRATRGLPSPITTNVRTNNHFDVPSVFASCTALPFQSKSFEYATMVDVLEHLTKSVRPAAIIEAARVARFLVVIGPFKTTANVAMEARLRRLVRRANETMPGLEEHLLFGLPTLLDVTRMVSKASRTFELQFASARREFERGVVYQLGLPESERSPAADQIATAATVQARHAYRYVIRAQTR